MFTRWLTVSLVAIGLGIAALELWASPALSSSAAMPSPIATRDTVNQRVNIAPA